MLEVGWLGPWRRNSKSHTQVRVLLQRLCCHQRGSYRHLDRAVRANIGDLCTNCFVAVCKINKTRAIFFPGTSDGCTKNLFFFLSERHKTPHQTLRGVMIWGMTEFLLLAGRKCCCSSASLRRLLPSDGRRGFSEYDVLIFCFKGGAASHRGAMAEFCAIKRNSACFLVHF